MTPDELWKSLGEAELALLISLGVVMFSVTLRERLTTHEKDFNALKNPKAAAIIGMMKRFVASTR